VDLEEIKRIDLRQYFSEKYNVTCDSEGKASCPFHPPDKRPSFSIYTYDGFWFWKDHHDGSSGTIIDLVARMENISEKEAMTRLRNEFLSHEHCRFKNRSLKSRASEKKKVKNQLYYVYKSHEGKEVYRKVKLKYEDGSKIFWFEIKEKNGWRRPRENEKYEKVPYELDRFKDFTEVIVAEGEKDANTINNLGIDFFATSSPCGKSSWPSEITKYFSHFKKITFLYDTDADEDVLKHAATLKKVYSETEIYIAHVPLDRDKADITDYVIESRKKGEDPQMNFLDLLEKSTLFELKEELTKTAKSEKKRLEPIIISLESVAPERVEWLWDNRIPLGKLTLVVGDPGDGKSFLTIFLASNVTTGKPWPDNGTPIFKGSVIILTAEDGLADTVRIRADASGADVKKIKILEGVITKNGEREFFNLIDHLPALEQAIIKTEDVRLVIIDPITSYLGTIDSHKNTSVRGALAPIASLAEKYKIAVVAVTHLNKNVALQAIYRPMGSLAFTAAARSVWAVSMDENDEGKMRRFFTPLKTNLSINPTSLAFNIINTRVIFENLPVDIDAEEALSKGGSEEISILNQAIVWLKEALDDGPIASKDIYRMARENNISDATLRRSQQKLKIKPYKEGSAKNKKWFWRLSND